VDPKAGRAERRTYRLQGDGFAFDTEDILAWVDDGIDAGAIVLDRLPVEQFQGQSWRRIERRRQSGLVNDPMADISNIACTYIARQDKRPCFKVMGPHWLLRSEDKTIRFYLGRPKPSYIRMWLCMGEVQLACALPRLRKRKKDFVWVFRRGKSFWQFAKSKEPHRDTPRDIGP